MLQAENYTVQKLSIGTTEVVRLTDAARKTEVSIAPSMGNIAYEFKVNGKNAFWMPVTDLAQLKSRPAMCCNPFLWPWANRIDGDAYWANGKKYLINRTLGNIRSDQNGKPIHGLLMFYPGWELVETKADGDHAETTSRLEFWKHADLMAQFPFAHTVEMTHRLREGVLEVEVLIRNLSDEPIPVAVGYHPYFKIHDAPREQWRVHLAARESVMLSNQLIPTGERKPVPYTNPVSLKGVQLDDVFTNLIRDEQNRAEFSVEGEKEKISVIYGPKYQVAVVYAPAGRDFICFEPMAGPTNAFNLAHEGKYAELQTVPVGGTWRESYWIKTAGF
jgi:aldose 1-epimerase